MYLSDYHQSKDVKQVGLEDCNSKGNIVSWATIISNIR